MTLFQKSLTNRRNIRPQKRQKEWERWYCRSKTPLGATPKYEKRYVFTKTSMFHKRCFNYCSAGPLPPKTPALLNKSVAHCLRVQSHKLHAFAAEQATTISKYWQYVYDCIVIYGLSMDRCYGSRQASHICGLPRHKHLESWNDRRTTVDYLLIIVAYLWITYGF